MDPQKIPPRQHVKEKQPMTALSPKTLSTHEAPSKQPSSMQPNSKDQKPNSKSKKKPEATQKTTQETSKIGKSLDSRPSVRGLNAMSPRRNLPSTITIENPVTRQEMTQLIKTGVVKKKVPKEKPKTKTEQKLALLPDEHPGEPIKSDEFPFYFDRKCITFVGRVGDEPVEANLVITNTTKFPYMFKVKSSNNNLFKIRPSIGFVDALTDAEINITYGGSHVPPLYQEWITVHGMMPDPMCLNIYEAFKAKNHYEFRRRILTDFAYHEDVGSLLGNQPLKIYKQHEKFLISWTNRAVIKRKQGEMRTRLEKKIIPESPNRVPQNVRERASQYYEEQKKNSDWKNTSKTGGVKPIAEYKWDYIFPKKDDEKTKRRNQEKEEEKPVDEMKEGTVKAKGKKNDGGVGKKNEEEEIKKNGNEKKKDEKEELKKDEKGLEMKDDNVEGNRLEKENGLKDEKVPEQNVQNEEDKMKEAEN
ncbi:unnamed protein product [Caenorhabditis brenneri]